MIDQSKLAIVTSGGGMTCAYSAGGLLALADVLRITSPGLAIGSSGSTGSLAYYVAKQYSSGPRVWVDLLSVREFIDRRRLLDGKMMDIDFLIDRVFKEMEPLDVGAVRRSSTRLVIAVTDYETGKPAYFDNRGEADIFEALRASKAAPVVYNREVLIGGRRYLDGDFSSPLERNIDVALDSGAERVIAIDNANKLSRLNTLALTRYARRFPAKLRAVVESYIGQGSRRRDDPRVVYVTPTQPLPVGTLDNDKENLRRTMDIGYGDVVKNPGLRELLAA